MKKIYESPVAEVISFTAMEQMANLEDELSLDFSGNITVISNVRGM